MPEVVVSFAAVRSILTVPRASNRKASHSREIVFAFSHSLGRLESSPMAQSGRFGRDPSSVIEVPATSRALHEVGAPIVGCDGRRRTVCIRREVLRSCPFGPVYELSRRHLLSEHLGMAPRLHKDFIVPDQLF